MPAPKFGLELATMALEGVGGVSWESLASDSIACNHEERMASSRTKLGASLRPPDPTPLPVSLPQLDGLDLNVRYHSDCCGGDFFDAFATASRVVFVLMDIAGKAPEAPAIAAEVQNVFRTRAQELFGPAEANESEGIALLARDVNRALIEAAHGVRFAPAFLGCFNLTLGILTYHNAGSLLALFHDAVSVRILEPGGIPLGLFTHSTYEPAVLAFEPLAKLLLVTKGIPENQRGAASFGDERVRQLLEDCTTDSAGEICETVLRDAYDFLRPPKQRRRDDLTVVTLVRPRPSGQP